MSLRSAESRSKINNKGLNLSLCPNPVQGIVISKLDQGAKLLITVDTPEGALLATFTRKVDEINLLVSEGDVLEFSLLKYEPFITDPAIHRVRKDGALSTLPQEMEVKEEPKGQEMKKSEDTKKPSLQKTKPESTHKPAPKPDKQQDEGIQKPPPAPLPQEQKEEPAVKQNVL